MSVNDLELKMQNIYTIVHRGFLKNRYTIFLHDIIIGEEADPFFVLAKSDATIPMCHKVGCPEIMLKSMIG